MVQTSHTFGTAAEAAAFMAGYNFGKKGHVVAKIGVDPEEPEAVNIDMDELAENTWLSELREMEDALQNLG